MGRLCWTRQVWGNGRLAQAALQLLKSPAPYVPHRFFMKSSGIVFSCLSEEGTPQSPVQTFRRRHGHCGSCGSSHPSPTPLCTIPEEPLLSGAAAAFPCFPMPLPPQLPAAGARR